MRASAAVQAGLPKTAAKTEDEPMGGTPDLEVKQC